MSLDSNQTNADLSNGGSDSAANDGAAVSRDLTGCDMGDLRVMKRLGRGGMADVYLATQVSLDRQVAVKVLRSNLAGDSNYVERFRREARAAAKLSHPNIVQVFEVGQWDGLHYISQEYIDGMNLREQIDRNGPLSLEQGINVMLGVAAALDAAATQGITHRDIKPENIMFSSKGEVKVADFGLARISNPNFQGELTQVGLTLGTPLYMSPEQVQGESVDVRSDLYSLGVTMFHVLAGRPPFEADTPLAIAVKHLHDPIPRFRETRVDEHVPDWMDETIARLMAKKPDKRFESPSALIDYLQKKTEGSASLSNLGTYKIRWEATRELQSAMDAEPSRRRHRLHLAAAWSLPVVALLLGGAFARNRPIRSIDSALNVGTGTIARQETIEEQYYQAMRLNTAAGWQSVWQTFPPDEAAPQKNEIYAAKAKLQLARLYHQQESWREVERYAKAVVIAPNLPAHLTAIAMAYQEDALRGLKNNDEAAKAFEFLQAKWDELSDNGKNLFRTGAPQGFADRLGS